MKYLGGKQKIGRHIADAIIELMPLMENVDGYLEPFCGALGVFVHMTSEFEDSVASDYHPDLIRLWKEVKSGNFVPPTSMTEEKYLELKHTTKVSAMKAFVGFGLAFGGRYFGSYAPKYKNGKKENFLREASNSINKIRRHILNAKFHTKSYDKWKPVNKVIYCDPPYRNSKYPIKYRTGAKKYDEFDNDAFWETMREWSKENYVFISEINAPDDFTCIFEKSSHRCVAQSTSTRFKNESISHTTEKLYIHKSVQRRMILSLMG